MIGLVDIDWCSHCLFPLDVLVNGWQKLRTLPISIGPLIYSPHLGRTDVLCDVCNILGRVVFMFPLLKLHPNSSDIPPKIHWNPHNYIIAASSIWYYIQIKQENLPRPIYILKWSVVFSGVRHLYRSPKMRCNKYLFSLAQEASRLFVWRR